MINLFVFVYAVYRECLDQITDMPVTMCVDKSVQHTISVSKYLSMSSECFAAYHVAAQVGY